jgi:hypothetical protein
MASLVDRIRPVVLLEGGERLLCAAYARSTAGPTVGPAIVAVSDRRLLIAPRSAFLSASAWTRRPLGEIRVVTAPRARFGMVVGRRFEMLDSAGTSVVFEVEHRKDAGEFQKAFARRSGSTR